MRNFLVLIQSLNIILVMKKLLFAVGSAYTAFLVFLLIGLDQLICKFMPLANNQGFVYVAFIAWAVYFFSGATLKGGIKAAIGYGYGIVFSILIMLLARVFSSTGFFAVPLGAMVVIFFVLYLEKVPWFDLLPASFVAAGCFFGIMTYVVPSSMSLSEKFCTATTIEIIYGPLGLLWGWFTIAGRGVLEKMITKKK